MKNILNNTIKYTFIFIFLIIFFLLIIIDKNITYNFMNINKISNLNIFIFLIYIIMLYLYLKYKYKLNIKIKNNNHIKIIFIILFIIQLIIFNNIYFETGWDPKILKEAANQYALTNIFNNNTYFNSYPYFDIYPNNIILTSIFSYIYKLAYLINISNPNKLLVIISIILVDISGIMTIKTISNFTKNKKTLLICTILFCIFIGLNPWFLIPYSDTFSIIIPISILYNYTKKNKKFHNYLLIGLLSTLGFLIKPTNIIIFIAIIIIELFNFIFNKRKNIKEIIKKTSPIILGILIIIIITITNEKIINYNVNHNYNFSMYHFLMMGSNEKTNGSFYDKDVINSLKQKNYNERVNYNLKVFMKRIKSRSFSDHINFYQKKLLLTYNDGTLAWGNEGDFFNKIENKKTNIFKEIFYTTGKYYHLLSTLLHTIWLLIILFSIYYSITNKNNKINVVLLSLIGLTLYILLFETRARYLYLYTPFFIILASLGIENLKLILHKKNI